MKTKKRSLPKMEHFFPSNSSGDLRSNAHQSQIIWGEADVDHTQIIGGGYSQNIWGIYPPGFRHPCSRPGIKNTGASVLQKQNKKKFFKNFLQAISKKAKKKSEQIFRKVSVIFQQSFDLSKSIVQSSAKDMAIFEDMRLRGQGQGLDL